jgi:transcription elongation factor Elf1
MIKILKSGNCISLILGLESADDRILKSMGKSITIEQTEKALKLCYDSDIATHGNFIFGDIEETIESANKTLNWWEKHRHYNISLAFIIAYPGTHIYKYALQNGTIKDPVKFLKDGCPQINISKLSNDELSSISKRIISLNSKMGLRIDKMEKITLYSDGISFDGKCIKCGKIQHFNHVRLFSGSNSVICSKCGQKSQIELPKELEEVFLDNLQNYLDKKYKIGLWGIYRITINLFENNNVFKNDNVFFVDSAEAKQLIKIHDKKVYSPDELLVSEVDIVIFFYQKFYLATAEEVKLKYPKVKKFINVYDLLKKRG